MIKITFVENGKPTIGLGVEYDDIKALKDDKKTIIFEIGGQMVHVAYIESMAKFQEKLRKSGMKATVHSEQDIKQGEDLSEKKIISAPGQTQTTEP